MLIQCCKTKIYCANSSHITLMGEVILIRRHSTESLSITFIYSIVWDKKQTALIFPVSILVTSKNLDKIR